MTELLCDADSTLLSGYQDELETRVSMGTLKLRSLRACLRAAVDSSYGEVREMGIVEQHKIDNLLKIKPEIATNLWVFKCAKRGISRIGRGQEKIEISRRSKL
ncbi:hypothetical protein PSCICL_24060 [Pseudomonas cichorii]|nr:hypothetical protein PSCICL_24060 [Pseudomonas cichorii]